LTIAPDDRRAGHLFGIRLAGKADVATLEGRLRDRRVYVSVRGDALRVSVHVYNDEADIQALRKALFK